MVQRGILWGWIQTKHEEWARSFPLWQWVLLWRWTSTVSVKQQPQEGSDNKFTLPVSRQRKWAEKVVSCLGQFSEDLFSGEGIYTYSTGDMYMGTWESGKKNGNGIYYFKVSTDGFETFAALLICIWTYSMRTTLLFHVSSLGPSWAAMRCGAKLTRSKGNLCGR